MTGGPNQQRATGVLQLAGLTDRRFDTEREAVGARHFQLRYRAGWPEDTDVGQRALRPDNGHALPGGELPGWRSGLNGVRL